MKKKRIATIFSKYLFLSLLGLLLLQILLIIFSFNLGVKFIIDIFLFAIFFVYFQRNAKSIDGHINLLNEMTSNYVARDFSQKIKSTTSLEDLESLSENIELMRLDLKRNFSFTDAMISLSDTLQNSSNSLDVYEKTVLWITKFLKNDRAGIIYMDENRKYTLVKDAVLGVLSEETIVLTEEDMDCLTIFRTGTPHIFSDWSVSSPSGKLDQRMKAEGYSSSIYVPIKQNNKTVAIVFVLSKIKSDLTERHLEMGLQFSHLIRISLHNTQIYERINEMASRDGLTGVWNRRYYDEILKNQINQCKQENLSLSLVILDIDKFKSFNDTYGHGEGDQLLKHLASLMERHTRKKDIVARYGGEEFVIILPNTEKEEAMIIAERIREKVIEEKFSTYDVTVSLGLSVLEPDDDTNTLFEKADKVLYISKKAGGNKVTSH